MSYHFLKIEHEQDKKKFMPLLLMADESEVKIMEYLGECELFYLVDSSDEIVGVIVLLQLDKNSIEIKNISISPEHRGKGLGKLLVRKALTVYRERGIRQYVVGTANSSIDNLAFYQKLGFRIYDIKKDFFLNYPSEIWENGIRAMDMIMLEKRETDL
ncbi:ribosomal protein S18 acetylase RimI-like enzyme [Paenibacillus sp. RC73]|uniref:GNAT family N-acetyltransferase n=1 Tax=Paenibacillus sp. RC73 TaxID=3156250 RepID=UPI003839C37D